MRKEPRSIELLSPAKDLICGREAINHGADARSLEPVPPLVIRWTIYGSFAITPISIRLVFTWP